MSEAGLEHGQGDRERWEPSAEQIRRWGHRVVDLVADHLTGLPGRPVFDPFPNHLARAMLGEAPPQAGEPAEAVLDRIAEQVLPWPFGNGHPCFAGWVNGPPVVLAVLVEALAAALNPSVAGGNHAATYVEHQVLSWLRELVGFPADAGGLLVSGGSAATITALAVARFHVTAGRVRDAGLAQDQHPLIVYTSEQAHSAIGKAVEVLGLGTDHLRRLSVDGQCRLRVDALREALARDQADGAIPMAVAVTAGTVNTGAIDPLHEVREVCDAAGVWMHVDGAYGAPAILDARYRDELAPIAGADSLALDAHKWLYVPYDAGAVLVRDAALMRATFSRVASYLAETGDPEGVTWLPWFSEYGLEQTRPFRALKIWAALRYHGRDGYARSIGRDNRLADHLAHLATDHYELELVAHNLSIVALRYRPPMPIDDAPLDELNRQVLRTVQLNGQAFLSGTELDGRFVLRACFINPRTTADDVHRIADAILGGRPGTLTPAGDLATDPVRAPRAQGLRARRYLMDVLSRTKRPSRAA
jgi:glutamate/tyrosine decarboxylase-like PLP-dependent enzyme